MAIGLRMIGRSFLVADAKFRGYNLYYFVQEMPTSIANQDARTAKSSDDLLK